jgi:hypothetical protein
MRKRLNTFSEVEFRSRLHGQRPAETMDTASLPFGKTTTVKGGQRGSEVLGTSTDMDPQAKQGSKHMRTPVLGVAGNWDVEKGSYEKSSVDIG